MGHITDKDSASEREKLQKDLQNTKTALEDIKKEETSSVTTQNSNSNASSPRILGDEQVCIVPVSFANINWLFLVVTFSRDVLQEP